MLPRGGLAALALSLMIAAAPVAGAQPPAQVADLHHQVVTLEVPVDPSGAGELDIDLVGGVLHVEVTPLPVMGPGGSIDTGASLVRATLIGDDGVSLELPSIVVGHDPVPLPAEVAQALEDAQGAAEDLAAEIEGLVPSVPSEPPEPPAEASDAVADLRAEVDALLLEVAWISGLLEAAGAAAADDAATQQAIVEASIGESIAAGALLRADLERIAGEAQAAGPAEAEGFAASFDAMGRLGDAQSAAQAANARSQRDQQRARDHVQAVEPLRAAGAGADAALIIAGDLAAYVSMAGPDAGGALADASAVLIPAALGWAEAWVNVVQMHAEGDSAMAASSAQASIAAAQADAVELAALGANSGETQAFVLAARIASEASAARDQLASISPVPLPASPLAAADRTVCLASFVQACLLYDALPGQPDQAVTVTLAIPEVPGLPVLPDLPIEVPGMPDVPDEPGLPDDPGMPAVPSLTGTPTVPSLPGLPSGSLSGSASSSASSSSSASMSGSQSATSTSSSSSSSGTSARAPRLDLSVDRADLDLRMGQQGAVVLHIKNIGDAADMVHVTASGDAPVAAETDAASFDLAAGATRDVTVRLTPSGAGSGMLSLMASGDKAASVTTGVAIDVAAAPVPAPAASIDASLAQSSLAGFVGHRVPVTVSLRNDAASADTVTIAASAEDVFVEPASQQVRLQPGESASRQVWLMPTREGSIQVAMAVSSANGLDLHPLVLLDVESADAAPQANGSDADGASSGASRDSPGAGLVAVGLAVTVVFALVRRKLEK